MNERKNATRWLTGLIAVGVLAIGGLSPAEAATSHQSVTRTVHHLPKPTDTGWNGTIY